jgi:hypothetical protein
MRTLRSDRVNVVLRFALRCVCCSVLVASAQAAEPVRATPAPAPVDQSAAQAAPLPKTTAESPPPEKTDAVEPAPPEKDSKDAKKSGQHVRFYQPELLISSKADLVRMLISGVAPAGSELRIEGNAIPVVKKNDAIEMVPLTGPALAQLPVKANNAGYFAMEFEVPEGIVQMPVVIRAPTGASKSFQLNLQVDRTKIELANKKELEVSPKKKYPFTAWLGVGYNFLSYGQTMTSPTSKLAYDSFSFPALMARVDARLSDLWSVSAGYNRAPGKVASTSQLTVTKGNYLWTITSLEALREIPYYEDALIKGYFNRVYLRAGFQSHNVPFLTRTDDTSQSVIKVSSNTVTMLTGGIQTIIKRNSYWAYDLLFRAQYPVAIGSEFKMFPKFAFDGGLGTYYTWHKNYLLGAYWYGQWQEYSFTSTDPFVDSGAPGKSRGHQALFFSNLELRFGFQF